MQSKFRLLVVRLGAMGDILHALPAVTALRQAHPAWIIDWVVEPRWRALLAADPSSANSPSESASQPESGKGSVSGHDLSRAAEAPVATRALAPAPAPSPFSSENAPIPATLT